MRTETMRVGRGRRIWAPPRSVYKVDKNNPGAEVVAETATALAVASLVFRRCDPTYSKLLIRRAIRVFAFADKYRGSYSNGLRKYVCPFYCSFSVYEVSKSAKPVSIFVNFKVSVTTIIIMYDELLWGAAWLHKATKNIAYLNYIKRNGKTLGAAQTDNTFGWDNKHVGARILLSKAFLVQRIQTLYDYNTFWRQFEKP